jgi:hypothetical protein
MQEAGTENGKIISLIQKYDTRSSYYAKMADVIFISENK